MITVVPALTAVTTPVALSIVATAVLELTQFVIKVGVVKVTVLPPKHIVVEVADISAIGSVFIVTVVVAVIGQPAALVAVAV